MTLEEKIDKAISNKAFDRCIGCKESAIKEIKKALDEEIGMAKADIHHQLALIRDREDCPDVITDLIDKVRYEEYDD